MIWIKRSFILHRTARAAVALTGLLVIAGCHADMWTQPKVHKPLQESDFFADGSSARQPVAGTIQRRSNESELRVDNPKYTGIGADKKLIDELPSGMTANIETLKRGKERFNIYCSPCHGRSGDGKGMIAMRGLALRKQPGNYHTDTIRQQPLGHYYDVITNGFGVMYSYSTRVEPEDRWKIAAYIRVLQASHTAGIKDVPEEKKDELDGKVEEKKPTAEGEAK